MDLWGEICGEGGNYINNDVTFSVIKTISQKEEYRFAHLSLQEFLYLDHRRACQDQSNLEVLFREPRFDNVLRIGFSSPEITRWLLNGNLDLRLENPNERQLTLLIDLARHSGLRSVILAQCWAHGNLIKQLQERAVRFLIPESSYYFAF